MAGWHGLRQEDRALELATARVWIKSMSPVSYKARYFYSVLHGSNAARHANESVVPIGIFRLAGRKLVLPIQHPAGGDCMHRRHAIALCNKVV